MNKGGFSVMDDVEISFKVEDFSVEVLGKLQEAIDRSLYAAGVLAQEGATNSISGLYNEDNRAVKTGRLRASISFITPKAASGSQGKADKSKASDVLQGRAESKTMIFGSNVEYAAKVHNGMWTSEKGGKTKKYKVRPFLREGIDKKRGEIADTIERIFKGES